MGELMTEKGDARPFMGELKVLIGEWRELEGPMEVGLSRDGCIPRCEVGEPRGEEGMWPDKSAKTKHEKEHVCFATSVMRFLHCAIDRQIL